MNADIVAALTLGFVLGLQHALDPDHLVAVSTIVSEHKNFFRSSLVGTFWGLGHTASIFSIGLAVIALKVAIPQHITQWMELSVAAMLVALGFNALRQTARERGLRLHTHEHFHDGSAPHKHIHLHKDGEHNHEHKLFKVGRKPFIVGLVHGMAGSAAVVLAALATVPSVAFAIAYIALFGLGSIGGMLMMSAMISLPFVITARRFSAINGGIRFFAGLFSLAFGFFLAWKHIHEIWRINP